MSQYALTQFLEVVRDTSPSYPVSQLIASIIKLQIKPHNETYVVPYVSDIKTTDSIRKIPHKKENPNDNLPESNLYGIVHLSSTFTEFHDNLVGQAL